MLELKTRTHLRCYLNPLGILAGLLSFMSTPSALCATPSPSPSPCSVSTVQIPVPPTGFSVGASNNALFISQSGNVGIGTSTPTAQLEVAGSSGTTLTVTNSSPTQLLSIDTSGATQIGSASLNQPLSLYADQLNFKQTLTTGSGTTLFDGNLSINVNPIPSSSPAPAPSPLALGLGLQVGSGPGPGLNLKTGVAPTLAIWGSPTFRTVTPALSITLQTQPLLLVQKVVSSGSSANVGINEAQPQENLDLGGTLSVNGDLIQFTKQNFAPPCPMSGDGASSRLGAMALTSLYTLCICTNSGWQDSYTAASCQWR